jgi:hypothetical protein
MGIRKCDKPSLAVTETEIGGMREKKPSFLNKVQFVSGLLYPEVTSGYRCANKVTYKL